MIYTKIWYTKTPFVVIYALFPPKMVSRNFLGIFQVWYFCSYIWFFSPRIILFRVKRSAGFIHLIFLLKSYFLLVKRSAGFPKQSLMIRPYPLPFFFIISHLCCTQRTKRKPSMFGSWEKVIKFNFVFFLKNFLNFPRYNFSLVLYTTHQKKNLLCLDLEKKW